MPNTKSAAKRSKQNKKRQIRNYETRSKVKSSQRKIFDALKKKDVKTAETELSKTFKIIDLSAKKNVIHKNNAARKKSRLAKKVNTLKSKEK